MSFFADFGENVGENTGFCEKFSLKYFPPQSFFPENMFKAGTNPRGGLK
jgi:hypothetical protein